MINMKNIEHFGINLTEEMQDLQTQNNKTLRKEIKEG